MITTITLGIIMTSIIAGMYGGFHSGPEVHERNERIRQEERAREEERKNVIAQREAEKQARLQSLTKIQETAENLSASLDQIQENRSILYAPRAQDSNRNNQNNLSNGLKGTVAPLMIGSTVSPVQASNRFGMLELDQPSGLPYISKALAGSNRFRMLELDKSPNQAYAESSCISSPRFSMLELD